MLTIWGRTSSGNVQKVMWCIAELRLAYERIDAGLAYGKNNEDWYLRLNPNGRVPLLQDGSFSLWESNSIVRYLCAKHDHGGLYAASPETRAHAERWMDWQLSVLAQPVSVVFWNLIRLPAAERDAGATAKAAAEAERGMVLLDRHLAAHRFVAGEHFSMGDIPVGATVHRWLALPDLARPDLPALRAWHQRLSERAPFRDHVMLPLA